MRADVCRSTGIVEQPQCLLHQRQGLDQWIGRAGFRWLRWHIIPHEMLKLETIADHNQAKASSLLRKSSSIFLLALPGTASSLSDALQEAPRRENLAYVARIAGSGRLSRAPPSPTRESRSSFAPLFAVRTDGRRVSGLSGLRLAGRAADLLFVRLGRSGPTD